MEITQKIKPEKLNNDNTWLTWWMRIVGSFYLLLFIASSVLKLPIKTLAPVDTLEKAAAGDPLALFLIDTWVILGLAIFSIGLALLVASRRPTQSIVLVWTVIGFELIWGICSDIFQIFRGHPVFVIGIWIVIHIIIISMGILSLRKARITNIF
ncbi:MAG: BphX family protein [Saprospiraceae bacterium]